MAFIALVRMEITVEVGSVCLVCRSLAALSPLPPHPVTLLSSELN